MQHEYFNNLLINSVSFLNLSVDFTIDGSSYKISLQSGGK